MQSIIRYLEIVNQYPHYFSQNDMLPLVLDYNFLTEYTTTYNTPLGVIYESPFYLFIVDLIKGINNKYYTYSRIINLNPTNGLVVIPIYQNDFVLLKQFRHGTRAYELEFPRGFSEANITPLENVTKELNEELEAEIRSIHYLGEVISDSGLSGGSVDIFVAYIDKIGSLSKEEGIDSVQFVSNGVFQEMVLANKIRDGFTLSAYLKYIMNEKEI